MACYSLNDISPSLPDGFHWIAENATVLGDVELSVDCGIWFGAVLRGDNERITIGPRSNIQDNCVLHTDMGFPLTVGQDCTIGHRATLHGCTVGDNTLVGMSAIILNGAVIGRNCLVGAGALVTEGKQIPDNSLVVGSPGKVIRELDRDAIKGITGSAQRYVENAKRFAEHLKPHLA